MIELLRQMILSVTAASLFGAVVLAMVPDGAMKEVLRMGTGLLLIVSLVLPLQRYTPHTIGDFLPRLERQTARSQDTTDLIRQEILREVVVEAAQNIEQMAQSRQLSCKAQVMAQIQEDNQVVIQRVCLQRAAQADDFSAFKQTLARQLGISADSILIQ